MPAYVSIAPYRVFNRAAYSSGFLGPKYAPLTVGASDVFRRPAPASDTDYAELKVDDLAPPDAVDADRVQRRIDMWRTLQSDFLADHPLEAPLAHDTVYQRAVRLMNSEAAKAFDLEEEPDRVRDQYGRGRFGQGCLMARRLIEQGVSFVEVSLAQYGNGALAWDTHRNNFATVKSLCEELDAGWATLMRDLDERGLLDSTTIVWMGEFGRTPKVNRGGGRDHYPKAWSCVLAGGGIRGGSAYGRTTDDGAEVADGKVGAEDVLATLSEALGVPCDTQNVSGGGRPFRIADGTPIKDILA